MNYLLIRDWHMTVKSVRHRFYEMIMVKIKLSITHTAIYLEINTRVPGRYDWLYGGGHVLNFFHMFTRGSLHHGNVNDVIYDADAASEGRYGCKQGPI